MLRSCALALLVAGCYGQSRLSLSNLLGGGSADPEAPADTQAEQPPPPDMTLGAGQSRRMTRDEYANTVRDLLGLRTVDTTQLPQDARNPFDNDAATQIVSGTLIESAELLADRLAAELVADPALRARLVPCTPSSPGDSACFLKTVQQLGHRLFRRPFDGADADRYLPLLAWSIEDGSFDAGLEGVLRAMLQDPEFLYIVEVGEPEPDHPGLYRLTPHEVASRLSYFFWGSAPDDALLALADEGGLRSPAQAVQVATRLMIDERAKSRVDRFHALWLGYENLPIDPTLADAMRAESSALIRKVVFEDHAPWSALFSAQETFIDASLARHYGLPEPSTQAPAWVPYGASGRRGLLSHGSFLSVGKNAADTSPTLRGKMVRNRLMCQHIDPPPPEASDVVPPGRCKTERFASHANGGCAGCHGLMDPVGFGLEQFDRQGRFRTHDDGDATCPLSGDGELTPVGRFNGPGELGDALLRSGRMQACMVTQLHRYALGRMDQPEDRDLIEQLTKGLMSGEGRLDTLWVSFAGSPQFLFRREAAP